MNTGSKKLQREVGSTFCGAQLIFRMATGLGVSVDDAFCVRGIERIRNLNRERQKYFCLQWPPRNAVPECHTIQKLHRDECLPVLIVNFVDRADVWMIQGGRSFGFALETAQGLWVFGYVVWQEFEGNEAIERDVLCFVHHTHAATAELLDDAIVRYDFPKHGASRPSTARHVRSIENPRQTDWG
jgi:hypothetical protein